MHKENSVFVDLKGFWTHAVQFSLKNIPTFMPKCRRVFVLVKWLLVMTLVNILAGEENTASVFGVQYRLFISPVRQLLY